MEVRGGIFVPTWSWNPQELHFSKCAFKKFYAEKLGNGREVRLSLGSGKNKNQNPNQKTSLGNF